MKTQKTRKHENTKTRKHESIFSCFKPACAGMRSECFLCVVNRAPLWFRGALRVAGVFVFFVFSVIPASAAQIDTLVRAVNKFVINPLVILLFAVALAYFLFGVVKFLANADNETARAEGKKHMLWGIVGMFIMIAVFAIMQILITSLGIQGVDIQTGEVNLN